MNWVFLIVAGLLETVWAYFLKQSEGFTRLVPSVITVVGMIVSFYFLSLALKQLPLGTAYAIWTGIGTVGTVLVGIMFLHEPVSLMRMLCVLLIVSGIIGLKLFAH